MYNLGSAKTMIIILLVFVVTTSVHILIVLPVYIHTYCTYKGKVIGKHLSGSSTEDEPVS